jgi:hypothetical protein
MGRADSCDLPDRLSEMFFSQALDAYALDLPVEAEQVFRTASDA